MQRSLAVDTGTLDIPEPDHGVDLKPLLHDTLLPDEGTEPTTDYPPEQI